jgi:hypothetical protein
MSKKHVLKSIFVAGISLLYFSCANYSTMQSADVLGAGKKKLGTGVTYTSYKYKFDDTTDVSFNVPAVTFWYRLGVTDKLDLHANLWIPLGASVGAKYQFIGGPDVNGFGLSSGLDVGYLQITSGDFKTNLIDFYVPLYMAYDFSQIFSLYLVPKYIGRLSIGSSTGFSSSAAGTLGLKIGNRVSCLLEGTYGYDFTSGQPVLTVGVGFDF